MDGALSIKIIMATDARGLAPNATVLNSLRQHNLGPIHVRIFVRDLPAMAFQVGEMKIEFIVTPDDVKLDGRFPHHVSSGPAFDRMAAIKYCEDWDRALILDYDQLIVGDIRELFTMQMGDALAAGRVWNLSLANASREWFGRRLPHAWRHCQGYRFLMFGPVLNLKKMREHGTFEKIVHFQKVADSEEQIAFHIACEDRVMGLPDQYNLVPEWDGCPDNAVIYHYTGPRKPWLESAVVGADIWKSYHATWDELTGGRFDGTFSTNLLKRMGTAPRLLHLGCGSHHLNGWMNSDLLAWHCDDGVPAMDMRCSLPFADDSLDVIYTEHAIQYLTREEAEYFLKECFRVLRFGGVLRVVTLDRDVFSDANSFMTESGCRYKQWAGEQLLSHISAPTHQDLLEMMQTSWGHQYIFTPRDLRAAMNEVRFNEGTITIKSLGDSASVHMESVANKSRLPEGFLEFESMVVEAVK